MSAGSADGVTGTGVTAGVRVVKGVGEGTDGVTTEGEEVAGCVVATGVASAGVGTGEGEVTGGVFMQESKNRTSGMSTNRTRNFLKLTLM